MRRCLILIGLLGCLGSLTNCSEPTPEELASLAAKGYYEHLFHGEYEQFLAGKEKFSKDDSTFVSYKDQLLDNCHQFVRRQEQEHHGVRDIRISSAKTDTLLNYTNVFLVLCFGDSVNEEVVVPMVERNGKWLMK